MRRLDPQDEFNRQMKQQDEFNRRMKQQEEHMERKLRQVKRMMVTSVIADVLLIVLLLWNMALVGGF